jgi:hypothetical protein
MADLWWVAGEGWEVDGQESGSKNMPPFFGFIFEGFPFWESPTGGPRTQVKTDPKPKN